VYHIVRKDETLWKIARAYNRSERELLKINNISDAKKIKAGTVLFIPDADKVIKIKPSAATEEPSIMGQKETAAKRSYAVKPEKKETAPGKETTAAESFGANFIWPVRGKVSSKFGRQNEIITLSDGTKIDSTRYNNGIIIDAREGAPVVASENGVVDKTDTFKYYGKTIIIKHGRGYMTVYSYLKEIMVTEGERVKKGETIGLVGKHARSNDNKFSLHFEIRHKNRAKNPLFYLPKSK
jgi:lipoprotein NlpD